MIPLFTDLKLIKPLISVIFITYFILHLTSKYGLEKSTESMIIMLAESVVIPLVLIFVLTKLMRIYNLII